MPIHSTSTVIDTNGQELCQHGTLQFPCALYTMAHKIQVSWHWHEEFECTIIQHGSLYYNTPQGRFLLQTGDGVILNSQALHTTEFDPEVSCRKSTLVFHGRLVYGTTDSIFYQKYVSRLLAPDAPQILILRKNVPWHADILEKIKKAARLYQNKPEGYEFSVRNLLSELLFDLYCYSNTPFRESQNEKSSDHERIRRMLLYLQENFARSVTVSELAEHVSISERECLRCFKRMLHMSPIQYLIHYRISRACRLLREDSATVLEIGSRCGFESPSYFTKTFRQIVGCTPTQYREMPHSDPSF